MIENADPVVVPTTTRDDDAGAGVLLLAGARPQRRTLGAMGSRCRRRGDPGRPEGHLADVQRVVDGFFLLARGVIAVPFDHYLVDGELRHDLTGPVDRRAWLSAAAAVARGL